VNKDEYTRERGHQSRY